jgi:hypothetical protein
MKKIIYLPIAFILFAAFIPTQTRKTDYSSFLYSHVPMPMDTAQSLQYKWDHKKVLASMQVDGMESLDNWVMSYGNKENVGNASLSNEKVFEGKTSIKFVCPTKQPVQLGNGGRYWGRQNLTRKFNSQNFSKYNRISIEIFPVFKGFRQLYLTMILNNDANVPDQYGKEGWHTVMLKNNQWNKLVMEIPHLFHDKVNGITISYGLQGNEPDAADTIVYYADNLMMESVKPDYFEGWGTDDEISFTHSGYNISDKKTALSSSFATGLKFKVVDLATNTTVLEKEPVKQYSNIGTFSVFDFSELKIPGNYKISFGNTESKPFPINKDIWEPVIEKITNYFFVNRCGFGIPGIRVKCHTDWYTVYKGDTIVMAGGWHDAGDLSQSSWQTADATAIFFRLARKYQSINTKLSNRLIEEGLWGLEWVQKNHFDGLIKFGFVTHDHYSDGKIGNFDDTPTQPGTRVNALDNYYAILANVEASLTLKKINPLLSEKSRNIAVGDWDLLAKETSRWNLERLSMAIMTGARLFELTGNNEVKSQIVTYADSIMTFQQKEPMKWRTPLSGFFYMNKGSDDIFGYQHSVTVASPIAGLVELCKLFPTHQKYPTWLKSVQLQANYVKTIAQFTAPYYMIPANVYKTGTNEDIQVRQGVKMDDTHFLRMFPVWQAFRGNSSIILSSGITLAAANQLLKDPEMKSIAQAQLEFLVGKNPFSESLMYGEGYNFSPQYAAFTGDVTGGLPVGMLTYAERDVPYWKTSVLHNYKEIWGQPGFHFLELLDYIYN